MSIAHRNVIEKIMSTFLDNFFKRVLSMQIGN